MEAFMNALTTDPINTLIYLAIVVIVIYAAIKIGGALLKIGLLFVAIYLIYNLWSNGIVNDPRLNNIQTGDIISTQLNNMYPETKTSSEPLDMSIIPNINWNNTPHP